MKDFGFAFNDIDFSDRILRIEIASDDKNQNLPEETGDATHSNDLDSESVAIVKVKTLHIASPILAKKSPFFYKLFKNWTRESQEKHVTVRINASEEAALMDLLDFMYEKPLSATTIPDLLNVLMVADKFEVTTCMTQCCKMLLELPMSLESATLYLELPSHNLMAKAAKPLKDASKQYIAGVDMLQEAAMELSLSAVELILSSDDLRVKSEDSVFEFLLKWTNAHHPTDDQEYQQILNKLFEEYIRVPYMSPEMLDEALMYLGYGAEEGSKLVREALFFKAGVPTKREFMPRDYEFRPVKVVQFEFSWPRCVVSFNVKRGICANLFPSHMLYTEAFRLGRQWFFLYVQCREDERTKLHHFGLFVEPAESSETCTLDFEFEVMSKQLKEFQSLHKAHNRTLMDSRMGCSDLFKTPWSDFLAEDSDHFIDGFLHLRADVTLKNSDF